MRRYYFDVREEGALAVDEEGMELPNFKAVQEEATKSLADLARDAVRRSPRRLAGREMAMEVRDAVRPVLHVKFALTICRMH